MIAPVSASPAFVSGNESGTAYVAATGRVLLATIFIWSGIGKILDPAASLGYISSVGLPFAEVGLGIAILVEIIGGIALISIATALLFHSALGDQNQFIHFMKNLAMAGGLLQVAAFGAGRLGLDVRN